MHVPSRRNKHSLPGVLLMNSCCSMKGNAKIVYSNRPGIHWRVMCQWCGLILHEQKQKGEEKSEERKEKQN